MVRVARILIVRTVMSARHKWKVSYESFESWPVKSNHKTMFTDVVSGPSKILCKYPDCTNPSCQFRHEDANGNPIPPPALTRQLAAAAAAPDTSSAMETDQPNSQDDIHVKIDQSSSSAGLAAGKPLESAGSAKPLPGKPLNATIPVPCRFGAGCTNVKCKFVHENKKPCNFGVKCFKGAFRLRRSCLRRCSVLTCTLLAPLSRSGLPILAPTRSENPLHHLWGGNNPRRILHLQT
jgi:hypothetical protein